MSLSLVSNALAVASTVPALPDSLGPYPMLQLFGGLIILAGTALTFIAGERKRQQSDDAPPAVADIYLEGPLSACISRLDRVAAALERMAVSQKSVDDLREEMARRVSETRSLIYEETGKVDHTVRQLQIDMAALGARRPRGADR